MKLIEIGCTVIVVVCTVVIMQKLRKVESILHDQGMVAAEQVVADASQKRHLRVI